MPAKKRTKADLAKATATRAARLAFQREAFCLHFVQNGQQGKKAAIAAGYAESNAPQQAWALLQRPEIKARINELFVEHFGKLQMGADETLGRLAAIARADLAGLFDEGGNMLPLEQVDPMLRAAIESFETELIFRKLGEKDEEATPIATRKVKLASKLTALQAIAKVHKLTGDAVDITSGGKPIVEDPVDIARRIAFLLTRAAKSQEPA